MNLEIDHRYVLRVQDAQYPVLEQGNDEFSFIDTGNTEVVAGEVFFATVVGIPDDRPGFVLVHNHGKDMEHLVHIESIDYADDVTGPHYKPDHYISTDIKAVDNIIKPCAKEVYFNTQPISKDLRRFLVKRGYSDKHQVLTDIRNSKLSPIYYGRCTKKRYQEICNWLGLDPNLYPEYVVNNELTYHYFKNRLKIKNEYLIYCFMLEHFESEDEFRTAIINGYLTPLFSNHKCKITYSRVCNLLGLDPDRVPACKHPMLPIMLDLENYDTRTKKHKQSK